MPKQTKTPKSEATDHLVDEMLKEIPASNLKIENTFKKGAEILRKVMKENNTDAADKLCRMLEKNASVKECQAMHNGYSRGRGNPQLWKMLEEEPEARALHKLFNKIPEENKISLKREYEILKLISGIPRMPFLQLKEGLDPELRPDWVVFKQALPNDTLNSLRERALDCARSNGTVEASNDASIKDDALKTTSRDKAWHKGRYKVFDAVLCAVGHAVDATAAKAGVDAISKAAQTEPWDAHNAAWKQIERANIVTAITSYAKRDIVRLACRLMTEDIDSEEAALLMQAKRLFRVWQAGCEPVCEVNGKIYVVVPPKARMPVSLRKEEPQAETDQDATA